MTALVPEGLPATLPVSPAMGLRRTARPLSPGVRPAAPDSAVTAGGLRHVHLPLGQPVADDEPACEVPPAQSRPDGS